MNYIDIILGILVLWGLITGFRKGLFVSLASLIGLVAGIYITVHFSGLVGEYVSQYVSWSDTTLTLAAFAITFIAVIVLISLAGKLLTKIADFASLGILNKLLGATFGVLKFTFIASVVLIFVDAANRTLHLIEQETIDSSILYTPVKKIAPMILPAVLKQSENDDSTRHPV